MSANPLDIIGESPEAKEIFGSAENFLDIFHRQSDITQFGIFPSSSAHCIEVYNLIHSFILETKRTKDVIFSVNDHHIPIFGLFHHFFQTYRELQEEECTAMFGICGTSHTERLIEIAQSYNRFDKIVLRRYIAENVAKVKMESRAYRLDEISSAEKAFLSNIDRFLKGEFRDRPSDELDFYIILFFDFFDFFLNLPRSSQDLTELKLSAHFALRILPLVIGRYRFGNYGSDLKDMAFNAIDGETYRATDHTIRYSLPDSEWTAKVENKLRSLAEILSPSVVILKRRKGVFSSLMKSLDYNIAVGDLWDLLGFRLIIDSGHKDDCYDLFALIQQEFKQWESSKGFFDYISNPKGNGYQSIHTVIQGPKGQLAEIQIRTSMMDFLAEFGPASHQTYKQKGYDVSSAASTPLARQGRVILEKELRKRELMMSDFVEGLGEGARHVPLDHYLEGIATKRYDLPVILDRIRNDKVR